MFRSVLFLLVLCASFAKAQSVPVGYQSALDTANRKNVPLVVFVGIEGRHVVSAEAMECVKFPGVQKAGIVVGVPNAVGHFDRYDLPATATDGDIARLFAKATRPTHYATLSAPQNCTNGRCPQPSYAVPASYSVPQYYAPQPIYSTYGNCPNGRCPNR